MAAKLQKRFPEAQITLIPGGRGDFIVKIDGKTHWNKRQMGEEFPDEEPFVAGLTA